MVYCVVVVTMCMTYVNQCVTDTREPFITGLQQVNKQEEYSDATVTRLHKTSRQLLHVCQDKNTPAASVVDSMLPGVTYCSHHALHSLSTLPFCLQRRRPSLRW